MLKQHTFHIPVMGLGFTIDTPLKVARFGISSVVSIVEDELVEEMRRHHCIAMRRIYLPISNKESDFRAKRITAYLNLLGELVIEQVAQLREEPFAKGSDISKYFELLPDSSPLRQLYDVMLKESDPEARKFIEKQLREKIQPGSIDVNIMTKCDKVNHTREGNVLPGEYSDALAALRGFANSSLRSSVIFSAGLNPRLYTYCSQFRDFYPDESGLPGKKIVIKVSDFRSAAVQGRFLAKKGLWVSEYRIESGLNCGGHAFATQGKLLGPILEEFHKKRNELSGELFEMCKQYWIHNKIPLPPGCPSLVISAQGGIGTSTEDSFLRQHYALHSTGWGSPFLLVPEATNVDGPTLHQLATAEPGDYYVSDASPLGVPFNNFKRSSSDQQRISRIGKKRPGSPCYKKFLVSNTEFTETPICTASREYQSKKIAQLQQTIHDEQDLQAAIETVAQKECLCEGLGASARHVHHIESPHKLTAVAICPGPNLAYFSGVHSLREMVDHIYGRADILNKISRPHLFINELRMYVDYLGKELRSRANTNRKPTYFEEFRSNLFEGINYYRRLCSASGENFKSGFREDLTNLERRINTLVLPSAEII